MGVPRRSRHRWPHFAVAALSTGTKLRATANISPSAAKPPIARLSRGATPLMDYRE